MSEMPRAARLTLLLALGRCVEFGPCELSVELDSATYRVTFDLGDEPRSVASDLVARLRNLTVAATKLVAAVDGISSAPRLGDAYETSARLAAGPARVCYTHRMRACAWDAWPTPLV